MGGRPNLALARGLAVALGMGVALGVGVTTAACAGTPRPRIGAKFPYAGGERVVVHGVVADASGTPLRWEDLEARA